jgi:hypothetical protein
MRDQFLVKQEQNIKLLYRQESILAISRLPQSQNNVVNYYILQLTCKYEISSSALGRPDDPSRVLR